MSRTYCLPDCPKRSAYCHANCPDYTPIEKARLEKVKQNTGASDADCIMGYASRKKRFENARKSQSRLKSEREVLYGR